MALYMGPTASVAYILRKLLVIFSMVASCNVWMQNVYKVTQGNNDKVSSFAMRLEGTLNQTRCQCLRRMTDLEVQQHLKDCLFHRVWKHTWDSIWYLYSNPRTSYSLLMVTTCKTESENEEIQDRVRARSTVATGSGEGIVELGQQIVRLMGALTKAEQGSNPSSACRSPQERSCGRGHSGNSTPNHPNSHNGRSCPGQTTLACSLPTGCGTGSHRTGSNNQNNQGTGIRREGTANRWDPNSFQCFRCHPNPRERPASMKAARQAGPGETAPAIPFLNPDPVAHLVGWPNEAVVTVDAQKITALIDLGAQVSSISSGFCYLLTLEVHPLGRLLELEGTGGSIIPYLGYVEVNLQIPGIKSYNEDVLLLIIPIMTYSEKVPVMFRSKIIDQAMGMMTKGSLWGQLQPGDRLTLVQLCLDHSSFPAQLQRKMEK